MMNISPTIGGTQRYNGRNGADQTDAAENFNVKRIADQRNRWLESSLNPLEKNKDYEQVVTVFESKSGRHGVTTETAVETRFEVNSQSQSTLVSSKTVISSSSFPQQYSSTLRTERIIPVVIEDDSVPDQNGHASGKQQYINGSTSYHTPVSSKSFIQQRVERLYGPCALAQGFFHRSVKSPFSASSESSGANGLCSQLKSKEKSSPEKSEGSHELPVLRHLRPEFRDQLTVAPRRSLGSRFSNGSPSKLSSPSVRNEFSTNIHDSQQKTSSESLTDFQPAAREVVLPQQSPSISPMTKLDSKCTVMKVCDITLPPEVPTTEDSKFVLESHDNSSSASVAPVAFGESQPDDKEESAGHKFLKIQRQAIEKLLELAKKAEREIEENGSNGNPVLSEVALGHLRVAAGQARLLVTQKMVQFEGLCHKCINQQPDEPFPTTGEDLQGFWDMLLLQVDQVHNTFDRLDKLKAVGWSEDKLGVEDQLYSSGPTAARASTSAIKKTPRASKSSSTSVKSAETVALRKQREEERRKLMEQRRKELKQKQQSEGNSLESKGTVEIFGTQLS